MTNIPFNIAECLTSSNFNTGSYKDLILSPNDKIAVVQELYLIINLPSLKELKVFIDNELLSEDERNNYFWQQVSLGEYMRMTCSFKKPGYQQYTDTVTYLTFNRRPYYNDNLLARFTNKTELMLAPEWGISIKYGPGNKGIMVLGDYLSVVGSGYYSDEY